ncbi:hypothetical protein [Verrucosispora sp. WMMD573]|uniref:hypothetical protein n=1 Tax=Verrucosispora sp. WMMD573 TaxID=3015149 RepID=UPI00248C0A0D|nr:hypothetical protein [Verrucosispora sp. WMMD573]WBB54456.1 hypothetical protein O7601_28740 [Verrucosispora sp. WMMD573]
MDANGLTWVEAAGEARPVTRDEGQRHHRRSGTTLPGRLVQKGNSPGRGRQWESIMPAHRSRVTAHQRTSEAAIMIIVLATFGPYLAAGIRTEQAAVCAVAGLALLAGARHLRKIPARAMLVIAAMATYLAVAAFAAIGPSNQATGYGPVGFLAGLDNLLLPVIALTAGYLIAAGHPDRRRLLRVAALTLVAALAANAAVSYLMLMSPGEYDQLLSAWWVGDTGVSTAERATTMGRYSGIFNQPAEAGVAYSLGLIAAVYALRRQPMMLAAAGVVLTIGGLLTASKIFLLIGLPVALWQTWTGSSWRTRAGAALAVCGVLAVFDHQARQPDTPIGGVLLGAWLDPGSRSGSLIDLYTASRFGDNSTLSRPVDIVLTHSPWFGFGLDGLRVAYDSAWVEALVMAGIVGVAAQAAIVAALGWCWLGVRRWTDPAVARFGAGVLVVVAAGSLGLPTTTANRISSVVWLLVALSLVSPPSRRWAEKAPDPLPDGRIGVPPVRQLPPASTTSTLSRYQQGQ